MIKKIYVKNEVQKLICQIEAEYKAGLLSETIYDNQIGFYRTIEDILDNGSKITDLNIEEGYMFYMVNSTKKSDNLMDSMDKVKGLIREIQMEEKKYLTLSIFTWPIIFMVLLFSNSYAHTMGGYMGVVYGTIALVMMLTYVLRYQKYIKNARFYGLFGYLSRRSFSAASFAILIIPYEVLVLIKYFPWK